MRLATAVGAVGIAFVLAGVCYLAEPRHARVCAEWRTERAGTVVVSTCMRWTAR